MEIGQLNRSALRRALHTCFFEAVESMLKVSHKRGKIETRFNTSWRWGLTICSLFQQGILDHNSSPIFLREKAIYLCIHPDGKKINLLHQKLFSPSRLSSISDKSLIIGINHLSNDKILSKIDFKYRADIEKPWQHILPEDIGSCYEIIKELVPTLIDGNIELAYSAARRRSGIHHTPFDVTKHMVNLSLQKIDLFNKFDNSIPDNLVICDLAVGAGAFLIQFTRILSEISGHDVGYILENHVIGFDIDPEAILVCSLCFHLERNCSNQHSDYQLHKVDSVTKINSQRMIRTRIKEMMPSSKGSPTITIGNPPYVRVRSDKYSHLGLKSLKCHNLSAYFIEQSINISENGGVICQIVPLSLIQSDMMKPIRKVMFKSCSEIDTEAYDCVPGYMFDQGKIGSNSSKSITQRVAIMTAKMGQSCDPTISTTRFIRWGSQERNQLFSNLQKIDIPKKLSKNFNLPMLGNDREKGILLSSRSTNRLLCELIGKNKRMRLFVPKAIRYFATASREDLNRSQIELCFNNKSNRNLAQILINSSYFYWYWRIYGNGFQISTRDIMNIPIPKITNQEIFQNKIDNMANLLHKKREILCVTKSNNGMIRNIKYDLDPILINKLDDLIVKLFDWDEHFPFQSSKENSLQGYLHHFMK